MNLIRYFAQAAGVALVWAAVTAGLLAFAQVGRDAVWGGVIWILGVWAIVAIVFAPFERMQRNRRQGLQGGPDEATGPGGGRQRLRGAWRPPDAA